jgi:L-iditol 2-dehydrogenase
LGADAIINAAEQGVSKAVRDLTGGRGADLIIETSGNEASAGQGIEAAAKGAVMVFVGYSKSGMMNLPISTALNNELTLKTIFRYRHIYPLAIDAVARGVVDIKHIVTNVFDFDDIQNAMDKSVNNKIEIVKSVVKF